MTMANNQGASAAWATALEVGAAISGQPKATIPTSEVAAMVIVDAVSRLVPGVLGDEESARQDSFSGAERLVEGPQYTRPREFRGLEVPEILLSGDHRRIAAWRHEQAVAATRRRDVVPGQHSVHHSAQPQRSAS